MKNSFPRNEWRWKNRNKKATQKGKRREKRKYFFTQCLAHSCLIHLGKTMFSDRKWLSLKLKTQPPFFGTILTRRSISYFKGRVYLNDIRTTIIIQMIQFKMKQLVVGIFAFLFLVSLVHGEESYGDCALEVRGVVTSHIFMLFNVFILWFTYTTS